jgi:hypothetical protein
MGRAASGAALNVFGAVPVPGAGSHWRAVTFLPAALVMAVFWLLPEIRGREPADHRTRFRLTVSKPGQDPDIGPAQRRTGALAGIRQTGIVCLGQGASKLGATGLFVHIGHVGPSLLPGLIRAARNQPIRSSAHRDSPSANSAASANGGMYVSCESPSDTS